MKKIISLLITAATVLSCIGGAAKENPTEYYSAVKRYSDGVLVSENFETSTARPYGFTDIQGNVTRISADGAHGSVISVRDDADIETNAVINIGKQPEGGVYYIGYDVKNLSEKCYDYVAFLGTDNPTKETDYLRLFAFRNNGQCSLFNGLYTTGSRYDTDPQYTDYSRINYGNDQKYSADKWYSIDNYIDLDNRKMYIYVDNKLYMQGPLPDYYNEFCGIKLVQMLKESYYDNIRIYRMNGEIGFDFADNGKSIPESYVNYASVAFKTDTVGNIFFENTGAKFNAEIRNNESNPIVLNGKFYVTDRYNNVIWTKENTYELDSYEKTAEMFDIDTKGEKGYFNLTAEFTTDKASRPGSSSTRFSLLASPKEHNMRWGAANHFEKNGGKSAEMVKIMSNAGFGTIRTSLSGNEWQNFEREKGVYKLTDLAENQLNIISSNGMNTMYLLFGGNKLYKGEIPPYSDSEINAFAKACGEMAKAAGNRAQFFEVWNEYDLQTFNPALRPVEDYVKMLKAVYTAVKAANPNAIVVGLSPSGQAWKWAKSAVDAGALNYLDAVSLHSYAGTMSPESYYMVRKVKDFKDYCKGYCDENGIDEPIFVVSETGFSSGDLKSTKRQAAYEIRWMTLNTYNDLIDIACKYTTQDHDKSSLREMYFGMFKYWKYVDIPYEAKDNLLAISAYNTVMNGAAAMDDLTGNNGCIYRFKLPDNRQAIVAYALNGATDMAFKTSASVMEYIDMYGNKSEIKPNNGKVNLHLTDNPIYLACDDFGDITEVKPDFAAEKTEISGNPMCKSYFGLSVPSDETIKIEYSLMNGMHTENERIKNGGYSAELCMPSVIGESDTITIKAVKDGSVIYRGEFPVVKAKADWQVSLKDENGKAVDSLKTYKSDELRVSADNIDAASRYRTVYAAAFDNGKLFDINKIDIEQSYENKPSEILYRNDFEKDINADINSIGKDKRCVSLYNYGGDYGRVLKFGGSKDNEQDISRRIIFNLNKKMTAGDTFVISYDFMCGQTDKSPFYLITSQESTGDVQTDIDQYVTVANPSLYTGCYGYYMTDNAAEPKKWRPERLADISKNGWMHIDVVTKMKDDGREYTFYVNGEKMGNWTNEYVHSVSGVFFYNQLVPNEDSLYYLDNLEIKQLYEPYAEVGIDAKENRNVLSVKLSDTFTEKIMSGISADSIAVKDEKGKTVRIENVNVSDGKLVIKMAEPIKYDSEYEIAFGGVTDYYGRPLSKVSTYALPEIKLNLPKNRENAKIKVFLWSEMFPLADVKELN